MTDNNDTVPSSMSLKKDNKLIISFEEYLKDYLDIRNADEYSAVLANVKKTQIGKFPDLFKAHLTKEQEDDVDTKIIPLCTTNTLYTTILKYIALQKLSDSKFQKEENSNNKEKESQTNGKSKKDNIIKQ